MRRCYSNLIGYVYMNGRTESAVLLTGAIEASGDGVQEGVLRGQQPSHHRHPAPGRLGPPAPAPWSSA